MRNPINSLRWSLTLSFLLIVSVFLGGCASDAEPNSSSRKDAPSKTSLLIESTPSTGAEVDETTATTPDVGSVGRPADAAVIVQAELSSRSHGSSPQGTEPLPMPDHDRPQTAPDESKAGCPPSTGYILIPRGEENSENSACHDSAGGMYQTGISADSQPEDGPEQTAPEQTAPEQTAPEQTAPVAGRPYTWQDGDRTLTVFLQPDQVLTDDGDIKKREETKGSRATQGSSASRSFARMASVFSALLANDCSDTVGLPVKLALTN